jgi:phospholipase C
MIDRARMGRILDEMKRPRLFFLRWALVFWTAGPGLAGERPPEFAPARRSGAAKLSGTIADVQHVVVFMQENRSFDHYFGSLDGVRGFNDHSVFLTPGGSNVWNQPGGTGPVLPFHSSSQCIQDLDHSWGGGHNAWDAGLWDQWVSTKGAETMCFYDRADLPYYYALADAYTVCDDYHCSIMGPTNPNRLYLMSGMVDPNGTGGGPIINNSEPSPGFTWTTYPERLQAAGISWKVYQEPDNFDDNALAWFEQFMSASPGNPLYDNGMADVDDMVAAFRSDVTNGTLPRVSWLIAPTYASEHAPAPPDAGEALTKELLDALASNPAVYNSTVFILNYDENDGLFDHVPSPTPPAGTPDEFVQGSPIGLGVRVPMILVSPWTRGGFVCSQMFDHTSIIRFIESWTGVREPNISAWRRRLCGDLTSAFDFAHPDYQYPIIPAVSAEICSSISTPIPPTVQAMPAQETGFRPMRPMPCQPGASSFLDCASDKLWVVLTNAGTASAHFSVSWTATQPLAPAQYDVAPLTSVSNSLVVSGGGAYNVRCYGPAGFLRQFAGDAGAGCGVWDAESTFSATVGGFGVVFRNSGAAPVVFVVTNGYATGGPWTVSVPAGGSTTVSYVSALSGGWYDLGVAVAGHPAFERRLLGHVDTVGTPVLSAAPMAGGVLLSYPAWATGWTLESSPSLSPASWAAVPGATNIVGVNVTEKISVGGGAAFFRMRAE